jgi:hypothetical protein
MSVSLALIFNCFYFRINPAISSPLFSIKAAICSVFPPAPAQVSTTRIPGLTSEKQQLIVNWHLELQNPCLNTSVMKTLALSFKTKA